MEYPAYTWTKLHGFAVQSHETPVQMEGVQPEEAMNIAGWAPDRENANPFSSLWSFPMAHHGEAWRVMLRVATTPLAASSIPLENLALDPGKTYHAFDFWDQAYLGTCTGSFESKAPEIGCCQAVAFREAVSVPAVLGSDRHVSMDAVSILAQESGKGSLAMKLSGVPGTAIRYTLRLPDGKWTAAARSAAVSLARDGEVYRLDVTFDEGQAQVRVHTAE